MPPALLPPPKPPQTPSQPGDAAQEGLIDLSRPRVKFMLMYRCQESIDPLIQVPERSP